MLKTIIERGRNIFRYGHYIPVEYFIFDQQQLVYISVPKVACTSIKIALMGHADHRNDEYAHYMQVHQDLKSLHYPRLPARARSYFKFAFVRNPFDRLVSFYEDKVCRPVQHNGRYHFDSAYNTRLIRTLFGTSFTPNMAFTDFVRLVARVPDWLADAHFKSQYSMLYRGKRKIPDFIGHFETLDRDWATLTKQYGIPPLGRKNATTARDWRTYYLDKSVIDMVAARYRDDIRLLGYEREYHELLRNYQKPSQ